MTKKKEKARIKNEISKSNFKSPRVKSTTEISQKNLISTDEKSNPLSTGSYYIRPVHKGKNFSLYLKQYQDGKPVNPHQRISEEIYYRFGLNSEMTAENAKEKLDIFRKLNKQTRTDVARQDRAFKRYAKSRSVNQTLFPPALVSLFEEQIRTENFGSKEHLNKKFYIFATTQEIINILKLTPENYALNSKSIFKYFTKKKYSLNYCQKIIAMMNDWGRFASSKGSGHFKKIPQPKGIPRESIQENAKNNTGVRKEAIAMTQELLENISKVGINFDLTEKELNFFKATFYLGLRPAELMKTTQGGKYFSRITDLKSHYTTITIYQDKLSGVPENQRTKFIPLKYPEQLEAAQIIESSNFKKPDYEKIRKIAALLECNKDNRQLGLYSGRKGFANWVFDKGETSFEAVASWLGHLNTTMTFSV